MAFDNITTKVNLVAGDTSAIDAVKRNELALTSLTGSVGKLDAKYVSLGATQRSSFELSKSLAQSALRDSKAQLDSIEAYDRAYKELIGDIRAAGQAEDSNRQKASTAAAPAIRGEQIGKIGQLAGLAGVAGGAQAGQAVSVLIEGQRALELLGDVGRSTFETIKAGEGVLGSLATGLQAAVPGLSATAAGIGAITLAGGALAVVGTGLALTFAAVSQAAEDAAKNAKELTDQIVSQSKAQADAEQLLQKGDVLALLEQRGALNDQIANLKKQQDAVRARIDSEVANSGSFLGVRGVSDLERELTAQLETLDQSFLDISTTFFEVNQAIAQADPTLKAQADATYVQAQASERAAIAAKQSGEAEDGLAASREQNAAKLAALEQQERDLIAAFEDNQRNRAEDLARQTAREAEGGAIKLARANEDLNAVLEQQAATHADKMESIAEAGDAALEALQTSIIDKQIASAQAIVDAQTALAKESAGAAAKYQRDELRRLAQFNLDRLQSQRRFELSQGDAARANDIEALLEGRQQRNLERKEAQENFNATSKERDQDFAAERAAREQATAERIQAINTELASFTQATNARIQQETASIEQRKQLEVASFNEQQARDAAARTLRATRDAEDLALRQKYQAEDRAIADARAQDALNKQLARIDTEQAKLAQVSTQRVTALALESSILDTIIAKAGQVMLNLNKTPTVTPPPPSIPFSSQLTLPPSATLAGVSKTPRSQTAIRPPSADIRGMASASGRGGGASSIVVPVTIQGMNVGSLVSASEARQIATDIAGGVGERVLTIVKTGLRMAQDFGQ